MKWWGWGWADKEAPLEARPTLLRLFQERFQVNLVSTRPAATIDRIALPPSALSADALAEMRQLIGDENVLVGDLHRISHAGGKGYKDLIRARSGRFERIPDAIVFPVDEEAVRRLLGFAMRQRFAIVPFGGGTSVVGGVTPSAESEVSVTLDLGRMDRVLDVDVDSGVVTAEAGIRGPALEGALAERGLTLGHFPQSWEFSTLGGWIATRAAGGLSNRYGRVDDLVLGVRLVSPVRTLDVRPLPNASHGPDLRELIVGSEGTLGVITQATLRAHPLPPVRRFASRLFHSFADGIVSLRKMARERALPDMAYLSDEEETQFAAASAGRELAHASLLLMGFEGMAARVAHGLRVAAKACAGASRNLGARPAARWHAERFEFPYLRDSLLDHGILVDTVETAAGWSNLARVYEAGRAALLDALRRDGGAGLVLCHISHAYLDGASLYYTFLAPQQVGREIEQWEAVKAEVTHAFLEAGGALSHHHGIGADHAPYLRRVIGEDGLIVLRALKRELDPQGIMNPGKLITGAL
jgi:alkyldihydroxyacetonephosphate synthase